MSRLPALGFLIVMLSANVSSAAVERHVPSQYPTIQAAVNACNAGDVVIVAAGPYEGAGNRDIVSLANITIRSSTGGLGPVIHCGGTPWDPHVGITLREGGVLAGLTITGAYSEDDPVLYLATGTVSDCRIADNRCAMPLLFRDYGIARNCDIVANRSRLIGGIGLMRGGQVLGCVIVGNDCDGLAGAIAISPLDFASPSSLVLNCTIADNYAGLAGAAILYDASVFVANTILWGNTDYQLLAGLHFAADEHAHIYNSIVQDGASGSAGRILFADGVLTVDPGFAVDNYGLVAHSPCVDAGDAGYSRAVLLLQDNIGNPRVVGENIDIGAYEHQNPPAPEPEPQPEPCPDPDPCPQSEPDPDPILEDSRIYFPLTSIKVTGKPGNQRVVLQGIYSPADIRNEVIVWAGDYEAVLLPNAKGVFVGDGFTCKFKPKNHTFTITGQKPSISPGAAPWDFAVFTVD